MDDRCERMRRFQYLGGDEFSAMEGFLSDGGQQLFLGLVFFLAVAVLVSSVLMGQTVDGYDDDYYGDWD